MGSLIIGLGNKGGEYRWTRHNVGWRALDELQRRGRFGRERRDGPARVVDGALEGHEVTLARPQTYMNLSGRAGVHLTRRMGVQAEDTLVIHDEVDLALGRLQFKRGGSHGGHNGVLSLINSWQTRDFLRLRLGVGRPPTEVDTADHVLDGFEPAERAAVDDLISRAADAVLMWLTEGEEKTMNTVNRKT